MATQKFTPDYINYGKITYTNCSVSVFRSTYDSYSIANLPCGGVKEAKWVGNCVHVITPDGRTYVYDGFGDYSHSF